MNLRRQRRQIYSLLPLTTREPHHPDPYSIFICPLFPEESGAGDGTRTRNLLITNQLLYQLSYASSVGTRPACLSLCSKPLSFRLYRRNFRFFSHLCLNPRSGTALYKNLPLASQAKRSERNQAPAHFFEEPPSHDPKVHLTHAVARPRKDKRRPPRRHSGSLCCPAWE